jgi:hypothetical protein
MKITTAKWKSDHHPDLFFFWAKTKFAVDLE